MKRSFQIFLWTAATICVVGPTYLPKVSKYLNPDCNLEAENITVWEENEEIEYERTHCFSNKGDAYHFDKLSSASIATFDAPVSTKYSSKLDLRYESSPPFVSEYVEMRTQGGGIKIFVDDDFLWGKERKGSFATEESTTVVIPIYIRNNESQSVHYRTYGKNQLLFTLEAKHPDRGWIDISQHPMIRCGNGLKTRVLHPKSFAFASANLNIELGDFETELRIKHALGTSNTFKAKIDPKHFD